MLMRRTAVLGALVAAAGACTTPKPAQPLPGEAGFAQVQGLTIAYAFRQARAPTIIFESGMGDGAAIWAETIAALDPSIAFLAYDRPGYGASTAAPGDVRTSIEAAELLHELLVALSISGAIVLVGHSLGGLYIAKYASMFPVGVAGFVFVDARPPTFRAACDARGVAFCGSGAQTRAGANWPAHIVAELNGIRAVEDAAPALSSIASIPATIITSANVWPGDQGGAGFDVWQDEQEAFAQAFLDHRMVRAGASGHYVQRDNPALVAREISFLIERMGLGRRPAR